MSILSTPILLIASTRPAMTRLVFERIRMARPEKLYLSVSASPTAREEDAGSNQSEVLSILQDVDWPCAVSFRQDTASQTSPYGPVPAALDWFFSLESEGMILEDDCLPGPDFFFFCQDLLLRYRNDARVHHISGTSLQFGVQRGNASYYFGRVPAVWGWAGWRRVWRSVELKMNNFPQFQEQGRIFDVIREPGLARRMEQRLQATYEGRIKTWDHQYGYSIVCENGLCINPNVNLVSRLGLRSEEEPFKTDHRAIAVIPLRPMGFPLNHPKAMVADIRADCLQVSWTFEDLLSDIPQRILVNANLKFNRRENSYSTPL